MLQHTFHKHVSFGKFSEAHIDATIHRDCELTRRPNIYFNRPNLIKGPNIQTSLDRALGLLNCTHDIDFILLQCYQDYS